MLVVTSSISTWVLLTASAVTARPHGLHSNVSSGSSAWNAVRASCIVSPQHGQATYSYSRILLSPHPCPPSGRYCMQNLANLAANVCGSGHDLACRDQAADSRINPRSARRTASSKSRSIKRPPRNCSQETIRSRKMPRFFAGKLSAASQMVRSCESDSANMWPWSSEGGGCQPLSYSANILGSTRAADVNRYAVKLAQISPTDQGGGKQRCVQLVARGGVVKSSPAPPLGPSRIQALATSRNTDERFRSFAISTRRWD